MPAYLIVAEHLGQGIAPWLLLSHRINLLLETLNRKTEARQRRLDGIAHDMRGPLTRLQLRVEALQHGGEFHPDVLAGLQADLNALLALDRDLDAIAIKPPDRPYCREKMSPVSFINLGV